MKHKIALKLGCKITLVKYFLFRAKYEQDLSMFVVKNVCYIFLLSHSLYPGMIRMFKECDRKRSKVKDFAKRKLIPNEQVTTSEKTFLIRISEL